MNISNKTTFFNGCLHRSKLHVYLLQPDKGLHPKNELKNKLEVKFKYRAVESLILEVPKLISALHWLYFNL